MGRRSKNGGLAEVLVMLPWWVSVVLGCVVFAVMRWIIPSLFGNNPFLIPLALISRSVAWLPLLVFWAIGAIAFARMMATKPAIRLGNAIRPEHRFGLVHEEPQWGPRSHRDADNKTLDPHEWGASVQQENNAFRSSDGCTTWTLEALRSLEWKRFELLCAKYYDSVGFQATTIRCGADGGIDVKLFKDDPDRPIAVVQCKAWNVFSVGVKEVRELLGVMAHEKVGRGIFITTGTYTKEASSFGMANPIQLVDGETFVRKLQDLPKEQREGLLKYAFEGDYTTPTCASCGIKMIKRESQRGPFWGCLNYPRCRSTFKLKT